MHLFVPLPMLSFSVSFPASAPLLPKLLLKSVKVSRSRGFRPALQMQIFLDLLGHQKCNTVLQLAG